MKMVMASIMCMPFMLVFHQSKYISAIKRTRFTTSTYISTSSYMFLWVPYHCDVCLYLARCMWEWRRYAQ